MEGKKILISCPVRDRAWVLPYYLEHLYNLDYPKKLIDILWVVNQSKDESEKILKEFKQHHEHEYSSIIIEKFNGSKIVPKDERSQEIRMKYSYNHLSEMRNYILDKVKDDHAYLFSCDSDILVRPDCLRRLVDHDKDVISSVIYNGYLINPTNPHIYPNILNYDEHGNLKHVSNWYVKNAPILTESKVIPIDVSGAVYLISGKVAKVGRYQWNIQGEDIPFCNDVKNKGFDIFCDLGIFSNHIMDKSMLDDFKGNVQ